MGRGGLQRSTLDTNWSLHLHSAIFLRAEIPDWSDGFQAYSDSGQTGCGWVFGGNGAVVHGNMASIRERVLEPARFGDNGILGIPVRCKDS